MEWGLREVKDTQTTVLPDTTVSFEVDGDTYSTSGLHVQPSDAIQGEEPVKGNDSSGGNTTRQLIYWHHQEERRRSRGARGGHSPDHDGSQQRVLASSMKSQEEIEHRPSKKRRLNRRFQKKVRAAS